MTVPGDLPDRGPRAPVRPGGGDGLLALLMIGVVVIGGGGIYVASRLEQGWYLSLADKLKSPALIATDNRAERPPADDGKPRRLRPAGSPQDWVTDDDYPADALRNGWQGTVSFTLEVGTDGEPYACHVTRSSGTKALDDAACALLMKRAHFIPARDEAGRAITANFRSRFTWRIPE